MIGKIFSFILAVFFVFINGCTQIFYAKSMGYKIKPTSCAYFVGAIGNLLTGNIVPISAQSETLTMGGLIKDTRERVTALLIAALVGIIAGLTGTISTLVDFAGNIVISGMMAGVGLILCDVSIDMIKAEKRVGLISMGSAILTWVFSGNLVYTIAVSVLISTMDFCAFAKRRVIIPDDEGTDWKFWKQNYWNDFKLVKPRFSIGAIVGALSLICLNIGSNISFGGISAGMANASANYDVLTIINSAADIPSVIFGGMPLEVIISGTCSAPWPWMAGIIMMLFSGILLFSGVMIKLAKYVPAQSIAGFLFVIGFSATLVPNLLSIAGTDSPLEGIVAAAVTMISKNAFLGIVAGIIVKITGSLLGIV